MKQNKKYEESLENLKSSHILPQMEDYFGAVMGIIRLQV